MIRCVLHRILTFTVPNHFMHVHYVAAEREVGFRIYCSHAPGHCLLSEDMSYEGDTSMLIHRARINFEALKSLGGCTAGDEEDFGDREPEYRFEKNLRQWLTQVTQSND